MGGLGSKEGESADSKEIEASQSRSAWCCRFDGLAALDLVDFPLGDSNAARVSRFFSSLFTTTEQAFLPSSALFCPLVSSALLPLLQVSSTLS